jgi:hypothetical protein
MIGAENRATIASENFQEEPVLRFSRPSRELVPAPPAPARQPGRSLCYQACHMAIGFNPTSLLLSEIE